MAIDVGSRIRDYEIIARLKAGGMATLFLARRGGAAGFSRHVAIKVVHPHLAEDQGFIRMFIDEALLSARIQHPNVVHVEELGEDNGTYFLAMEYVHGSALSTLLGSLAKLERRLSPDLAVWIAMRLADGLHAAHELRGDAGEPLGVVHRDVSPQNVILSMTGHVKLIDFGIAKASSSSAKKTETGSLKGKLRYMAPEQAYGAAVDRRTDIYALGIVLWEMLTMHRMFTGANDLQILDQVRAPKIQAPSQLAVDVSPALDRVVLSALAADPALRPQTAQDFRRMLGEAVPAANNVDAGRVSEVLEAVLGERLEARRAALPESLSGVALPKTDAVPEEKSMKRDMKLRTMTLSAPGAHYHADQDISAIPSDFQEPSRRTGSSSFVSPPASTPAAPRDGTRSDHRHRCGRDRTARRGLARRRAHRRTRTATCAGCAHRDRCACATHHCLAGRAGIRGADHGRRGSFDAGSGRRDAGSRARASRPTAWPAAARDDGRRSSVVRRGRRSDLRRRLRRINASRCGLRARARRRLGGPRDSAARGCARANDGRRSPRRG